VNIIEIIPREITAGHPHPTRGTTVAVNGTIINGVRRIVLTADCENDLWEAQIFCLVKAPRVVATGVVHEITGDSGDSSVPQQT